MKVVIYLTSNPGTVVATVGGGTACVSGRGGNHEDLLGVAELNDVCSVACCSGGADGSGHATPTDK